jgi:hypothetical protein
MKTQVDVLEARAERAEYLARVNGEEVNRLAALTNTLSDELAKAEAKVVELRAEVERLNGALLEQAKMTATEATRVDRLRMAMAAALDADTFTTLPPTSQAEVIARLNGRNVPQPADFATFEDYAAANNAYYEALTRARESA